MVGPLALELHRVGHCFRPVGRSVVVALDDFTLGVARGECVAVVGPSGCGKTTLLRLIAGLERLQNGSLKIAQERRSGRTRCRVGLVFQDYALFPHLSVAGNIGFGLGKVGGKQRRQRVERALHLLELADLGNHFPHQLSAGQQQRVALARSSVLEPDILLLDEPFGALNPSLRDRVRGEILEGLKRRQATALLVTHDPDEAMAFADRVVLMHSGKIVQVGTPAEIYGRPLNPFAATFFGKTNQFVGVVDGDRVDTPAGVVSLEACNCSCDHFDGERVLVMVRPEGVRLRTDDPATPLALIESTRQVMHQSWVSLRLEGHGLALEALLPSGDLPPCGTRVALSLDHEHTFIFPRQH